MTLKNFIAICLLFGSITASAQFTKYRQFGIKAGMNISNVYTNTQNYTTKDVVGGTVSLTYDRVRARIFTFGSELNIIQRGYNNEVELTDDFGNITSVVSLKNRFNYFTMPVKLGIQLGNAIYVFGSASVVPGMIISAFEEIPIVDQAGNLIGIDKQDATSNTTQFDLATQLEAGIGITRKNTKFYVSGAKQDSFINMWNTPSSTFNIKNTGFIVSTGIKWEFGKGLLR